MLWRGSIVSLFPLLAVVAVEVRADKVEPLTRADAVYVVTGQLEGLFRATRPPVLKDTYIASILVTAVDKGTLEKRQLIAVRFRHGPDAGSLPILSPDFKPAVTRVKLYLGKRGSDGLFAPACSDWLESLPTRRSTKPAK